MENKELKEISAKDILSFAKDKKGVINGANLLKINKPLFNALDDVISYSFKNVKNGKPNTIKGLTKDASGNLVAGSIKNVDDLLSTIAANKLTPTGFGKVVSGLLKSTKTPAHMIQDLSQELLKNRTFLAKYGNFKDQKTLYNELIKNGFPASNAKVISKNAINNVNFMNYVKKSTGTSVTNAASSDTKNLTKGGYNVINNYFKNLTPKVKKRLFKTLGLVAVAGGGYAVYSMFFKDPENPTKEELDKFNFPPCITSLIENDLGYYTRTKNGSIVIHSKKTGIEKYDSTVGLTFYNNGRLATKNDGIFKKGSYKCNGDKISIVWDKDANAGGAAAGSTPRQKYHDCTVFPFEFGCRNQSIKDIQIKVGFPEKWQTGNFGPITKNKLVDLGYEYDLSQNGKTVITKELYNKIMGQTETSQSEYGQTQTTEYSPEEKAQQDNTRENQYIEKHKAGYTEFKSEYLKTNPNASEQEISDAFIKKYQADFDTFVISPGTYDQMLAENINEIKNMFKRII